MQIKCVNENAGDFNSGKTTAEKCGLIPGCYSKSVSFISKTTGIIDVIYLLYNIM